MNRIKTLWSVGLTATPIREDEKRLDELVGPEIHNIGIKELVRDKVIAPVKLVYINVPMPRGFKKAAKEVNSGSFTNLLSALNPNKFILSKNLLEYFHSVDKKVLVFFEYVAGVVAYAIAL